MTATNIVPTVVATYEIKRSRRFDGPRFGVRGTAWGTVVTITVKDGNQSLFRMIPWRYGGKLMRRALGTPRLDIELLLRVRSPSFVEPDPRFYSPRFGARELVLAAWDRNYVDNWIDERMARIPPGTWSEITHAMMRTFWVYIPDDNELIDEPAPDECEY